MKESREKKPRKRSAIIGFCLILVALTVVFVYSGMKIIDQLVTDGDGEDTYKAIAQLARPEPVTDEQGSAASTEKTEVEYKLKLDNGSEQTKVFKLDPVDFGRLHEQNKDVRAWITLPDTIIDYPVAQGENNDQYLRHLLDGSYHRFGTLFFDYRNNFSDGRLNDDISMIYGHNIRAGDMFHTLQEYTSQEYYEAHPYMIMYMENTSYRLDIFAMITINEFQELEFSYPDGDGDAFIGKLKSRSLFSSNIAVSGEDKLVGLFTCTNEDESERYVLYAKATELNIPKPSVN